MRIITYLFNWLWKINEDKRFFWNIKNIYTIIIIQLKSAHLTTQRLKDALGWHLGLFNPAARGCFAPSCDATAALAENRFGGNKVTRASSLAAKLWSSNANEQWRCDDGGQEWAGLPGFACAPSLDSRNERARWAKDRSFRIRIIQQSNNPTSTIRTTPLSSMSWLCGTHALTQAATVVSRAGLRSRHQRHRKKNM